MNCGNARAPWRVPADCQHWSTSASGTSSTAPTRRRSHRRLCSNGPASCGRTPTRSCAVWSSRRRSRRSVGRASDAAADRRAVSTINGPSSTAGKAIHADACDARWRSASSRACWTIAYGPPPREQASPSGSVDGPTLCRGGPCHAGQRDDTSVSRDTSRTSTATSFCGPAHARSACATMPTHLS